jgi:formiminotetrahydrofolate cyclodeaminase
MNGKLSGFARAAYGMHKSSDKEKMRQAAKRNKEAFDRYMNATAKYKGISNKEARRRHANNEFRKVVIKTGMSVALTYAKFKFENDPNVQKAVKNVVQRGAKILAKGIKAYANRGVSTLDKLEWGVVDAPGYTILN